MAPAGPRYNIPSAPVDPICEYMDMIKDVSFDRAYTLSLSLHTHCIVPRFIDDYHATHDPLSYIGTERNSIMAAHSTYVPPSLFNFPMPPPQHYHQVSSTHICSLLYIFSITDICLFFFYFFCYGKFYYRSVVYSIPITLYCSVAKFNHKNKKICYGKVLYTCTV